jgi:hypothetical protein
VAAISARVCELFAVRCDTSTRLDVAWNTNALVLSDTPGLRAVKGTRREREREERGAKGACG